VALRRNGLLEAEGVSGIVFRLGRGERVKSFRESVYHCLRIYSTHCRREERSVSRARFQTVRGGSRMTPGAKGGLTQ